MLNIKELVRERQQTFVVPQKRGYFLNERAELIRLLLDGINNTPGATKFFGFKQVGGHLKRFNIEGLRDLLKGCERASNFRAYFWYKVKISPQSRLTKTA